MRPETQPGAALVRLSIAATDGEWTAVRERALRHGLSISRYLTGIALSDLPAAKAGWTPALDERDERRLLEAVRQLQPLLPEPDGSGAPPAMPGWLGTLFEAWASAQAGSERAGEVRSMLAPVPGGGRVAPSGAAPETRATASRKRTRASVEAGRQNTLF